MIKKTSILILFISLVLQSCDNDYILLDDLKKNELSFGDLNSRIGEIYKQHALRGVTIDTVINMTGKEIHMDSSSVRNENYFSLSKILKGGYHIFDIDNNLEVRLKANQGSPFIFYKNSFYFCEELNLRDYNYLDSKYYKIDLTSTYNGLNYNAD